MPRPIDLPPAALCPPAAEAPLPALSSGWPALDAALGGGWPGGELSELSGHGCSTLAQAAVRVAQAAGQPVAWVDGPGTFCPATARVALDRLALVTPGAGGPAPRADARARHGRAARRALLAADLLLRSRAFGLLVLDAPGERAPPAAWFRLARQARAAQTVLLLLAGETPCAGSAAALGLRVTPRHAAGPAWSLPARPALELRVLRRRGATGGGVLLLDAPEPGALRG